MTRQQLVFGIGLLLCLACLYLFYAGIGFFANQDYLAGLLIVLAGHAVVRAGVQLLRLGLPGPSDPP